MALRRLNLTVCVCLVGGQFLSCNSSWTKGNTLWMNQRWACKGAEGKKKKNKLSGWGREATITFMKQVIDFSGFFRTWQKICVKMCLLMCSDAQLTGHRARGRSPPWNDATTQRQYLHHIRPAFKCFSYVNLLLIYCFSHALPSTFSVKTFIWASCNRPAEAKRADI